MNDRDGHAVLTPENGYPIAIELLGRRRPFTALFAYNDNSAIAAVRVFHDAGLRVPKDVSVIGFDDIQAATYTSPTLTTVRQPMRKMGEIAASTLLDRIADRDQYAPEIAIEPQFVVRQSTGPAPTRRSQPTRSRTRLARLPALPKS